MWGSSSGLCPGELKSTILETKNLYAIKKIRFFNADCFILWSARTRSNIPCLQQMSSFYQNTSKTVIFPDYEATVLKYSGIIIIIGFLINVQVLGPYPQQWAPFQVTDLLHAWQISTRSPGVSIMRVDSWELPISAIPLCQLTSSLV